MSTITTGLSFIDYKADGIATQFIITMPLMDGREKTDLKVYQEGVLKTVDVDYTQDATKITFAVAPLVDEVISLVRDTSSNARLVDFNDSSVVTKEKLDLDSLQDFYLAQEAADAPKRALVIDHVTETVDFRDNKGINLVDPTDAQDAATKNYSDTSDASNLQAAKDYSDAQDVIQDGVLTGLMDSKDAAQTIVLEGTMDSKDAAQTVILEGTMDSKDAAAQAAAEAHSDANDIVTLAAAKAYADIVASGSGGGISDWATGIDYTVGMLVIEDLVIYQCVTAHTSDVFATDIANWIVVSAALTAAEVKVLYESNPDTNALTDAEKSAVGTITGKVDKAGDTMTGDLVMSDSNIDLGDMPDGVNSVRGTIMSGLKRLITFFSFGDNGTVTPEGGNIFIGENAGNTTAGSTATNVMHSSHNVAIGIESAQGLTNGYENVIVGSGAGKALTTGFYNTFLGRDAGNTLTSENYTTAVGHLAGNNAKNYVTAVGAQAGQNSNVSSTCIGMYAGRNHAGAWSTFVGASAGNAGSSSADGNTAVGFESLASCSGKYNIAIGYRSAKANTGSGWNNITIGSDVEPPLINTDDQLNIGNLIKGSMASGAEYVDIANSLTVDSVEVPTVSSTSTLTNKTISYDNTSSGLTATNVQSAIDEVVTGISLPSFNLSEDLAAVQPIQINVDGELKSIPSRLSAESLGVTSIEDGVSNIVEVVAYADNTKLMGFMKNIGAGVNKVFPITIVAGVPTAGTSVQVHATATMTYTKLVGGGSEDSVCLFYTDSARSLGYAREIYWVSTTLTVGAEVQISTQPSPQQYFAVKASLDGTYIFTCVDSGVFKHWNNKLTFDVSHVGTIATEQQIGTVQYDAGMNLLINPSDDSQCLYFISNVVGHTVDTYTLGIDAAGSLVYPLSDSFGVDYADNVAGFFVGGDDGTFVVIANIRSGFGGTTSALSVYEISYSNGTPVITYNSSKTITDISGLGTDLVCSYNQLTGKFLIAAQKKGLSQVITISGERKYRQPFIWGELEELSGMDIPNNAAISITTTPDNDFIVATDADAVTQDLSLYMFRPNDPDRCIGVTKAAGLSGSTGEVYVVGSTAGGFSGLTIGATYYLDGASVTEQVTNYKLGIALSATSILITR